MYQFRIMLLLNNVKIISEYVSGDNLTQARYNAFKFTIPLYKKYNARVEIKSITQFRKLV